MHTGQTYDYTKAVTPIKHGHKLYTTGFLEKAFIRKGSLWLEMHQDTHTKEGDLVCQSTVEVIFRKGGYSTTN